MNGMEGNFLGGGAASGIGMGRFEHGGDVYAHPGVIDFSASLNPLGMPREVTDALCAGIAQCAVYPDPCSRVLTRELAGYLGVSEERIVCTAGASDLFLRLVLACKPKRAVLASPCFSGYEHALRQVGAHIERVNLDAACDFDVTRAFARPIVPGVDMVFLCSPNNPTGRAIAPDVLCAIARQAQDAGALLVVDECFIELSEAPSFLHAALAFPHVVVARAFTKTFSLAGLRLGYGVFSDVRLAQAVASCGCEWAVSVPAQLAGVAALEAAGMRSAFIKAIDAIEG